MFISLIIDLFFLFLFYFYISFLGLKLLNLFRIKIDNVFDKIVLSTGLGIILLSNYMLLLGILGLYHKYVIYISFLSGFVFLYTELDYFNLLISNVKKIFENITKLEKAIIGIIIFFSIFNLFFNYTPPTGCTEVNYILGISNQFIKHGKIVELNNNFCSYYPFGFNLVYVFGLLLHGELFTKMIHFIIGIFTCITIILFTLRYVGRKYSFLAGLIFYSIPQTSMLSGLANLDFPVAFFGILATFSIFKWLESKNNNKYFYLSAVFSGFATSVKFNSIGIFIAICFVIFFVTVIKKDTFVYELNFKKIIFFCILFMLFFSQTFIRNYIHTGNPVYPLPFLKNMEFNKNAIATITDKNNQQLLNYYYWPLRLALDGLAGTGPIFLAFIPLLFILPLNRNIVILLFMSLINVYVTITAFCLDLPRFIIFSVVIFSIIASYALIEIFEKYSRKIIIPFILTMIFPNLVFNIYFGIKRLPFLFGIQSREQYLLKEHPYDYEMIKYVNENVAANEKILLLAHIAAELYSYKPDLITLPDQDFFTEQNMLKVYERIKTNKIRYLLFLSKYFLKDENGYYCDSHGNTTLNWLANKSFYKYFKVVKKTADDSLLFEIIQDR